MIRYITRRRQAPRRITHFRDAEATAHPHEHHWDALFAGAGEESGENERDWGERTREYGGEGREGGEKGHAARSDGRSAPR